MAPRTVGRLSVRRVNAARPKAGRTALMIGDGGGLWLQVRRGEGANVNHLRRSWTFRYEIGGKRREMGLGPLYTIGLPEARAKAKALRQQLLESIDPLEARETARRVKAAEAARTVTFAECAKRYLNLHAGAWGVAHRHQWHATLNTYILPIVGHLSVADIDQAIVMRIVEPIWTTKPTTAGRVRNRLECILDYAAANQFRGSDNPARHIVAALPKKSKIAPVQHHAAEPWETMPLLMQEIRRLQTTAARCLEFLIYTAARSDEAIGATWNEIDLEAKIWRIPPERMKARVAHHVPLSTCALELLSSLPRSGADVYVFGGKRPLQETALRRQVLAKLRPDNSPRPSTAKRPRPKLNSTVTTHGMRSAFKTFAGERTNFARETVEAALAHKVGNQTEQSYEKGDKFEKRRRLMQAWSDYLAKPAKAAAGNVVSMKAGA
jgi:integrase